MSNQISKYRYLPHLDGVRGLSILFVMIAHSGFGDIVPGGLGVTIFYFISGFLITTLLIEEANQTKTISLKNFYMRRLWRLYPALLIYTLVSLIFASLIGQPIRIYEPFFAIFYLSNYFSLFFGYTSILETYSPFGIQGSLAIEEHFYLIFAPIVLFFLNENKIKYSIICLIIIPLFIRIGVFLFSIDSNFASNYTYSATECRIDSIGFGCLLALIKWPSTSASINRICFFIGILVLVSTLIYRNEYFRYVFRFSIQGIALILILGPVIYTNHLLIARQALSLSVLRFFGKISYSAYLYHWFVIIALLIFIGDNRISFAWQFGFWFFSLLLSISSFYLIERPCLKFRRQYGSHV